MKAKRDHCMSLSQAAVDLLNGLPTKGGEGIVFEGARKAVRCQTWLCLRY